MLQIATQGRRAALGALLAVVLLAPPPQALAETKVSPGFNVFSVQQDVEIGRQSAAQAERQLPLLNDRNVEAYVQGLLAELAPVAPGAKFPYQVKVVNASDINAFALPGGFLYLNRGLIEAARSEGELAGVMAHEIAHIALRHGTHNASKAYMTQAGLGVLGGILGRGQGRSTAQIINLVGGLGLNALFLKYSRDAETQADIVGTQMLSRAGYNPMDMASFFEVLQQQRRRDPGRLEQFMTSHPAPANRAARIQEEVRSLGNVAAAPRRRDAADFQRVQADLRSMPATRSMQDIARGGGGSGQPTSRKGGRQPGSATGGPVRVQVPAPSDRFVAFRHQRDYYEMEHPENWRVFESENGFGVTIVPEGGVVDSGDGNQGIVYGVIVNHYDPFQSERRTSSRGRSQLESATEDVVQQITETNRYLRPTAAPRRETVDGQEARSVVLSGRSPLTGTEERVTVFTRALSDDHVIYALFIAPGQDYQALSRTFSRMMDSLRVNDRAMHDASQDVDRDRW